MPPARLEGPRQPQRFQTGGGGPSLRQQRPHSQHCGSRWKRRLGALEPLDVVQARLRPLAARNRAGWGCREGLPGAAAAWGLPGGPAGWPKEVMSCQEGTAVTCSQSHDNYRIIIFSSLRAVWPRQHHSELQVLHDRQLAKHLPLIHPRQTRRDLAPVPQTGDVVQHGGVLAEVALLDGAYEAHRREVEVRVTLRSDSQRSEVSGQGAM